MGLAADAWLAGVMDQFFPLPVVRASFQTDIYVRGAALGLALPLLAAAVPVWRALRVTPIDAIRVGARAARSSGLAWLVRGVRVPGGALANLPLRNVLRTPRRTLMTLLGIGAVVTIVIALAGVMDSFDSTLAASRREALAGSPQRLTVDLVSRQSPRSTSVRGIAGASSLGRSQTSLRLASTLASGRGASKCRSRRSATSARSGIRRSATARCQPCNPGWSSRGARRSTCTCRSATASAWCIRSRLDRRPSGLRRRRCP